MFSFSLGRDVAQKVEYRTTEAHVDAIVKRISYL